jgi:hypothetical protein
LALEAWSIFSNFLVSRKAARIRDFELAFGFTDFKKAVRIDALALGSRIKVKQLDRR